MASYFVPVFEPGDVTQVLGARLALEGAGIPFFIQNENYLAAVGFPFTIGPARTAVLVPDVHAEEAREILRDWFARDDPPPVPPEPRPGSKGAIRSVAAPFLLVLGFFGLAELAIALGRKLSNEQSAEEASPD